MNCQGLAAKDWEAGKEMASGALERTERSTELSWNRTDKTKLNQQINSLIKLLVDTSPKVALQTLLAKQFYYRYTNTWEFLRLDSV